MYYTYVLKSISSGRRYIGYTSNLQARVKAHNIGLSPYTRTRGPWKLIYYETFNYKSLAIKREKNLKSGQGRLFLDSLNLG